MDKKIKLDSKIDFKSLNKPIGKKGTGEQDVEYTNRGSINLARKERDAGTTKKYIIIGVVILAVLLVLVKFGVVDQYAKLHEAEAAYEAVHQQNVEMQAQLEHYDEVQKEYRSYSMEWMNEESDYYVSVDRQTVLDIIETVVMPRGQVSSIDISKNIVELQMAGMTLKEISAMFDVLEKSPYIASVALNGAENETEENVTLVEFSVTITLISGIGEEDGAGEEEAAE